MSNEKLLADLVHAVVYASPDGRVRISTFCYDNALKNYRLEVVREGDELVFSMVPVDKHDPKNGLAPLLERMSK